MGTTNTRVWLVRGAEILACAHANVGVRDTARDGNPARIRATLRGLIDEVRSKATVAAKSTVPSYVAAAGMITSPLGLANVPHIDAPASASDLAAAVQHYHFPDITDLPIILVPGVRSGPRKADAETISQCDVMRGEETLCLGLIAQRVLQPPATLLNLGSHWKAIQLDAQGRIASSVTSISGELIHAAQTQTILASAVPQERPPSIDLKWCEAGMRAQRRSGLARALFCVRLLELGSDSIPQERLSFLVGAFVAADLDALSARGTIEMNSKVLITGGSAVAEAWRYALEKVQIPAVKLSDAEVERALLAGLRLIVELCDAKIR